MLAGRVRNNLSQRRYFLWYFAPDFPGVSMKVQVDRPDANHLNRLGISDTSNIRGKKSTVNQSNLVFYYFKILTANQCVSVTKTGPTVTS
jgi:hypothetical protein